MKIGIDISQTAHKGSGVARYMSNLVTALTTYDKENEYVFFYSSLRKPIEESLQKKIIQPHSLKTFRLPPTFLTFLWNRLHILPIENFIGNVDVFITSDWTEPPAKHALKLTTLHDMIIYVYPETVEPSIIAQQVNRHRLVKKESAGVFVDSISTEKDSEKYLGLPEETIHLLYPGVELSEQANWDNVKRKYNISKPFILTVGKLEPRKNIKRLLEAFKKTDISDVQLLVAGAKGWGNVAEIKSPHISFLGFVPDDELASLYAHAEFFVFPSLYEGFGYPVVEAMGYKCPVACSDTSSLTEIGGDSVALFNPQDSDDIARTISLLHSSPDQRKKLAEKGYARHKSFSLKKFYENFVTIVHTVYNDNRR